MKIPISWHKGYVEIALPIAELADHAGRADQVGPRAQQGQGYGRIAACGDDQVHAGRNFF